MIMIWGVLFPLVLLTSVFPPRLAGYLNPYDEGLWLGAAQALAAYTAGSAYVNHLDDVTGAIEPGMLADLTVLDRDPLAGPPGEIADTRVRLTYVAGERVYAAQDEED